MSAPKLTAAQRIALLYLAAMPSAAPCARIHPRGITRAQATRLHELGLAFATKDFVQITDAGRAMVVEPQDDT